MGEPAKMIVTLTVGELQAMIDQAVAKANGNATHEQPSRYVDMQHLADHYGVSKATVSNWIRKESCPHIQRGKVVRFEIDAVEAWFRGRKSTGLQRVK